MTTTTPKPTRYGHLVTAVRKCGFILTKELFLKILREQSKKGPDHPHIVDDFLKENETKIRKDPNMKSKIYIVYPKSKKNALVDEWDLSLYCTLLLHFMNVKGDIKDAIKKLRRLRNKIMHSGGHTDISEVEYNKRIEKLEDITYRFMKELDNDDLKSALDNVIEDYKNIKGEDVEEAENELKEWIEDERYRAWVELKPGEIGVDEVKRIVMNLHLEIEKKNPNADIEIPFTVVIRESNEGGELTSHAGTIFLKQILGEVSFLCEVESKDEGSVILKFTCPSITSLMFLLEYFSGPIFQRRLLDMAMAIEETKDDLVTLNVYVPQETYKETVKKLEGILKYGEKYQPIAHKRQQLSPKIFNDSLYGQIELHPLLLKIIDTPQFQRLRYIKQLETVYLVYPGASHNRFEHSIGVCHLAGKLLRVLKERQPELMITTKDILCVEIAALCHDLGQGPFSHVFERKFMPKYNAEWKHEMASVKLFETMLDDNERKLYWQFRQMIASFEDKDITFIKELIGVPLDINGEDWPYKGRDNSKSFLYEVVSNHVTGIDVDRWDYIARDSYMLGMDTAFDHNRCIYHARVLTVEGRKQICFRDKAAQDLYDMFYARITLYKRAYQHKTHNIIGLMVRNALREANDHISFLGKNGDKVRMSDTINDMKAYTHLTDDVIQKIQRSSKKSLERSKAIVERIVRRDFYKCVCQTQVDVTKKGWFEKTSVQENLYNRIMQKGNVAIDLEEILEIDVVDIDYGSKDKDPVANVWFYEKGQEDKPIRIDRGQVSFVLPDTFAEQYVRVYCSTTDSQLFSFIEESFAEWCEENNIPQPKGSNIQLPSSLGQPSTTKETV